jgi:hypothetical protein
MDEMGWAISVKGDSTVLIYGSTLLHVPLPKAFSLLLQRHVKSIQSTYARRKRGVHSL